jgi:4-amino-4-deoxy-L-arabinose transferase-like glycosyltransferase
METIELPARILAATPAAGQSGSMPGAKGVGVRRHVDALLLWLCAAAAGVLIGFDGPVYWDSAGYVQQAIAGQIGGLAFGRPVFVLVSHAVALAHVALGASPWHIELVLQVFWLCVGACSAPLARALARECGLDRRAAWLAGLIVAASPALAHVNGAVLTDAPALAVTCLGLLCGLRALNPARTVRRPGLAGVLCGAVLGLAVGLREQSIAQAAVCALALLAAPRPRRLPFAVGAAVGLALAVLLPVVWAFVTEPAYASMVRRWVAAMQRERARRPYGWRDVVCCLGWLLALGPAAFVAAGLAWFRHRRELFRVRTLLFALCVPALAQLALLAGYQDISYSPRYLLPALPGALAIPGALLLEDLVRTRRRMALVVAGLVLPALIAAPVLAANERPLVRAVESLPDLLAPLPAKSTIVTGQPCESVRLARVIARRVPEAWPGERPEWQVICPGWGWPDDLSLRLDRARARGSRIVLDLRAGSWLGGDQQLARAEAERWASAHFDSGMIVWR